MAGRSGGEARGARRRGSRVRDLMRTEVATISPELPIADLDRRLLEHGVGGLPVVEEGRLVGIVSRSDVVRQMSVEQSLGEMLATLEQDEGGNLSSATLQSIAEHVGRRMGLHKVRDLMETQVVTASPDEPLALAARRMLAEHVHRLPVVEDGALCGLISSTDFVRWVAESEDPEA